MPTASPPKPPPSRPPFAPSQWQRLRLDLAIARRAFALQFAYRGATFGGVATNFFFGFLRAAVLLALIEGGASYSGYDARSAVTYAALTQAVIAVVAIFGSFDLMRAVHSGEIAGDLLRPAALYRVWLARDFGRAAGALLLRGVVLMVLYIPFLDLVWPRGVGGWGAAFAALLLAWWVSFNWRFLVNLSAFWSPNAVGIGRFAFYSAMFFSGMVVPLAFFPVWVQRAAAFTPWPAMVDTVGEVYLGLIPAEAVLPALATSFVWGAALALLSLVALRFGIRRLVVLGG